MTEPPSFEDLMRAHRRSLVVKGIVAFACVVLLLGATMHEQLLGYLGGVAHGDHDLLGRSKWEPAYDVDGRSLDGIDLHRVHAELIPDWFIAMANGEADGARSRRAFDALRSAVVADRNLEALVVELHGLVADDPWAHADRLLALTAGWTDYLEERGMPWHLEGNVVDMGDGPFFYSKSYFVEADLVATVGEEAIPLRVLRRADSTNVREGYLGMVVEGQDRALVVLDRLREFALDELWQLADPSLDDKLAERERAFAPSIRDEMAGAVEPPLLEVLRDTASARWELRVAMASINLRRACGSSFVINHVPWYGFDKSTLDRLEEYADADNGDPCPSVTPLELDQMKDATRSLRETDALEPALEALVAWAARGTAVHEVRHVADHRLVGSHRQPPPCTGCDELNDQAVRELSAYLASFAWSEARYAALFQACDQKGGSHARAVAWLSDELGAVCEEPGADLGERAAQLEARLFASRRHVDLPDGWPAKLPVR